MSLGMSVVLSRAGPSRPRREQSTFLPSACLLPFTVRNEVLHEQTSDGQRGKPGRLGSHTSTRNNTNPPAAAMDARDRDTTTPAGATSLVYAINFPRGFSLAADKRSLEYFFGELTQVTINPGEGGVVEWSPNPEAGKCELRLKYRTLSRTSWSLNQKWALSRLKNTQLKMSGTMLSLLTTSLLLGFTCGAVYDYGAYDRTRDNFRPGTFPDDFIWSTATASYQIEGAWNVDGKGESIWDRFSHTPGKVDRGDTGDVACDSYNKYREDVQLMKAMGLKYYRFSLSWPRIFPDGTVAGGVNQAGVDYYNNVIDELLANGITPMVTLYHWDLPQALQDRYGGWVNEALVDHFNDYADFVFQTFGDRVRYWITFNEPWVVCFLGYGTGGNAPGIQDPGNSTYLCGHTILKAHAEAWNTYDTTYRGSQQGQISITLNCDWPEPRDPDSPSDVAAADRYIQFYIGWFAHPIYSTGGDYPAAMKDIIREKSLAEGLQESRLPQFTPAEIDRIKGTGDFFGLNHYTARIIQNRVDPTDTPGYSNDRNLSESTAPEWPRAASEWLYVVPWGLRRLLKFIKLNYGDPDVYITENGRSDHDEQPPITEDADRICYYMGYIDEVLKAIEVDGVKVRAYTAWSLMDNFEWSRGYTERFGLHYVNFTDPSRPRVPKESAGFYSDIIANNGFPEGADVTTMVRSRWEGCRGGPAGWAAATRVNMGVLGLSAMVAITFTIFKV
uniref:beta-glucosidase n=1 Tax=Branchiostoma floridae TaxID=7739 RepID=C3Y5B3_BRAFL|eukprot:XP_002608150.1 hypothetical protein BRAFLDRAFT_90436 [Branchiostoma floridae]